MKNRIEILCPSRKCGKCARIIKAIELLLDGEDIDAEIIIIDQLEELITKNTWILPTIIINDKVLARGYLPEKQKMLKELRKVVSSVNNFDFKGRMEPT